MFKFLLIQLKIYKLKIIYVYMNNKMKIKKMIFNYKKNIK